MSSIVDHPIFQANGLTPLDMADLMCHFLNRLFSGRMSTKQSLAFITAKLSGPGVVAYSEDEEMVFAKAMAQVYQEKYRTLPTLADLTGRGHRAPQSIAHP